MHTSTSLGYCTLVCSCRGVAGLHPAQRMLTANTQTKAFLHFSRLALQQSSTTHPEHYCHDREPCYKSTSASPLQTSSDRQPKSSLRYVWVGAGSPFKGREHAGRGVGPPKVSWRRESRVKRCCFAWLDEGIPAVKTAGAGGSSPDSGRSAWPQGS